MAKDREPQISRMQSVVSSELLSSLLILAVLLQVQHTETLLARVQVGKDHVLQRAQVDMDTADKEFQRLKQESASLKVR